MKIALTDNLLPHLQGTTIVDDFCLKNEGEDNHTVVDLPSERLRDLVAALKLLFTDVSTEARDAQRRMMKDPKPVTVPGEPSPDFAQHPAALQRAQKIRQAFHFIEQKIPPTHTLPEQIPDGPSM